MVELRFLQAVLVIWPFVAQISTPQAAAQHLQPCWRCISSSGPWREKKIALYTWRSLIFGWNSSSASFTIPFPERYRCSLLKSFADWANGTRLPCVHMCGFPQQFRVSRSRFSIFSLARATWRGALATSNMSHKNCDRMESSWDLCPMIWRTQKRRQRCRRRLLKSTPS